MYFPGAAKTPEVGIKSPIRSGFCCAVAARGTAAEIRIVRTVSRTAVRRSVLLMSTPSGELFRIALIAWRIRRLLEVNRGPVCPKLRDVRIGLQHDVPSLCISRGGAG